jgi:hypothetical protein
MISALYAHRELGRILLNPKKGTQYYKGSCSIGKDIENKSSYKDIVRALLFCQKNLQHPISLPLCKFN